VSDPRKVPRRDPPAAECECGHLHPRMSTGIDPVCSRWTDDYDTTGCACTDFRPVAPSSPPPASAPAVGAEYPWSRERYREEANRLDSEVMDLRAQRASLMSALEALADECHKEWSGCARPATNARAVAYAEVENKLRALVARCGGGR
jgi:hypothetical protein